MAHYEFKKDLKVGESGEKVVIKDLQQIGVNFISDNKDNRYDLLMEKNGVEVTYEVKTDVFCSPHNDTGNIFVEYESRGKLSGISVTKAKWFVTYFKHFNEIWYIKTEKLKNIISQNDLRKIEFGGDINSNTKGTLVPRYKFKKEFIIRKT